jgi:hypothetical protein
MYPGGVQVIKKIAKNIITSHDSSEKYNSLTISIPK